MHQLKQQFDSLDMSAIQVILCYKDEAYLLHTLKQSFDQLNKSVVRAPYKSFKRINTQSRQSLNERKDTNSSVGGQSQASCYDLISSHSRFTQERMQIEEDDIFKFNCHNIMPDDFVSLQLVVNPDHIANINEFDTFDKTNDKEHHQKLRKNFNE